MSTIILFDQSAPAGHSEGPAPNPVDGKPRANVWRCFARPDGTLAAGIWDCSKGSFAIPSHATDEMCSILEGEAVIEHADGTRVTVRPATAFSSPTARAQSGMWRTMSKKPLSVPCPRGPEEDQFRGRA